jgi:hypothetical protein
MAEREREVRDVVDDLYDILVGVEPDTATEACLTVLADLLGSELTYEDLRHIIEDARKSQEYV